MTRCIPTICVGFEVFVNFKNAFVGLYRIVLCFETPNFILFFEIQCIINNQILFSLMQGGNTTTLFT
jgi:hypothetical protein